MIVGPVRFKLVLCLGIEGQMRSLEVIELYRGKILNKVRFCSGLLQLVWIDEQNKKVNDDVQVKGQQKVIMGQ